MSKVTRDAHPYGEIFVDKMSPDTADSTSFTWRLSPVIVPLPTGGSMVFGNPFVAKNPAQAYREAINKARNVVKDGNVERVAVRGRGVTGSAVDLAVILKAEIAKAVRDPETCFLAPKLLGAPS